jgi:hypothetical protein
MFLLPNHGLGSLSINLWYWLAIIAHNIYGLTEAKKGVDYITTLKVRSFWSASASARDLLLYLKNRRFEATVIDVSSFEIWSNPE